MKKKLALLFITSLFLTSQVKADFAFSEAADYTGEAFFTPPDVQVQQEKKKHSSKKTTPPVKQLRLKIKESLDKKELRNQELAPTAADSYAGEVETSDYASKELVDDFDNMSPDGFEADEEFVAEDEGKKKGFFKKKNKKVKSEDTEDIVLDCENVDYDAPNYLINATGNVSVEFVRQGITVKSDKITFDRANNTIKAEGDVRILKNGQTITGDYIFVDMNEENALIENPLTRTSTIEIKSKKGYVYGDRIVQENGSVQVNDSYPINFRTASRGPQMSKMLVPKGQTLTNDIQDGIIKLKAQDIVITQKDEHEIISLKKARIFKGDKTIYKTPSLRLYTNKNHEYGETSSWEVGAYRGLGVYAGPGFVFELPKGSVLKAIPMLNYKSGFGIGGYGRFQSATNRTMAAYGTAASKIIVYGKQDLDDDLYLHYGVNGYMDEWFLGRRRPKYGTALVYNKGYSSDNFLLKGRASTFRHRVEGGYFQDLDFDKHFEKLNGTGMGTSRFRYMAEASQDLYKYVNKDKLKAFTFGMRSQLSSAVYGTGATQVIGRVGPIAHMQYKRWMQDIGYWISAYDDNTPMPVFDAYRYGKQSLYLREYFRINRYLTLSWFGNINLTGDSPNGRTFQENSFYISVGPDDVKFNLGYDFVRENTYFTVELMMDAKGANLEYDKLEIKQDKKAKTAEKPSKPQKETAYQAPVAPKVLQKAIVEDVKVIEDVL
ncbi:hypothetical protein IJD34_08030 [bacterium]|nr:hypothetical protein [bacterium]